jgi:hypothetical protein
MYQRGDRVLVEGRGGSSVLVVWEDRGRGVCLSSESGFQRALSGDGNAPLVGYPRRDIRGLADPSLDLPNVPEPLS